MNIYARNAIFLHEYRISCKKERICLQALHRPRLNIPAPTLRSELKAGRRFRIPIPTVGLWVKSVDLFHNPRYLNLEGGVVVGFAPGSFDANLLGSYSTAFVSVEPDGTTDSEIGSIALNGVIPAVITSYSIHYTKLYDFC